MQMLSLSQYSTRLIALQTLVRLALVILAALLMSVTVLAQEPEPPPPELITVSLPIATLDPSVPITTIIVEPVFTSNIDSSLNYIAFQGDFTFDETVVSFSHPPVQGADLTGDNWNVSGNVLPGPGPMRTLRISAISNGFIPLSGSGKLFELRMLRVSNTPGVTSPLNWIPDPNNFVYIDVDLNSFAPEEESGLISIGGVGPSPTATATARPANTVPPDPTATPDPRGQRGR
jgi:hypothetical protein